MKKLDLYIIRKFLGVYALLILLVMSVAIVFDITEKMDNFYESQLGWREIIMQYYIAFVPYYLNMFSMLFIFLSVIYFTSKMAERSEIIAMFAAGMSYHRFVRPYLFCATLLAAASFWLSGYVIPPASKMILDFTDKYVEHFSKENARNIQMEVSPGTVLYIESFQQRTKVGYRCSLEHFEGKTLTGRITSERIRYIEPTEGEELKGEHWRLEQYTRREFHDLEETLSRGSRLDTVLDIHPDELFYTAETAQMMLNPELTRYIDRQRARGVGNVQAFETEYHKRWAGAIGAFIMTLLGVTLSSRKVRGGMGRNMGVGIVLTALYILFSTLSTTFAVKGVMSAFMAAWLPNIVYGVLMVFLYRRVSR